MPKKQQQEETNPATRHEKGARFEEQVARWLRRQFTGEEVDVKVNQHATGLTVMRPYQIDVHVSGKGKGLFAQEADIWVECKWKEKASVKRTDVMKLVTSAQDVYRAARVGRNARYFNALLLVSNQRFDGDALAYADQEQVLCFRFDGKRYVQQNELGKAWLGEPAWLKRAMS